MSIADATSNFGFELPHPDNVMAEDCDRLRQALIKVDSELKAAENAALEAARLAAALSAQYVRLTDDFTRFRLALTDHESAAGSGTLPPQGYLTFSGARVAPASIAGDLAQAPAGAALVFLVGDSENSEKK